MSGHVFQFVALFLINGLFIAWLQGRSYDRGYLQAIRDLSGLPR